jgi:hypothetical protein
MVESPRNACAVRSIARSIRRRDERHDLDATGRLSSPSFAVIARGACVAAVALQLLPQVAAAATRLRMHDAASAVTNYKSMDTALGPELSTSLTNTVKGPTEGCQWTKAAGGTALQWISFPLASSVTISGAVTLNTWASESFSRANAGVQATVHRYTAAGSELAAILSAEQGSELSTAISNRNFTALPTRRALAPTSA